MTQALPAAVDVAVVGAGPAGIAALRRLAGRPLSVLGLEARARPGGRAWTVAGPDGAGLDMGAGWLHSADANPLADMAPAAGFTVDRTPPPWERQAFNLEATPDEQAAFGRALADFEARVAEAAGQGEDRAAADLFEPGGRWNARIDAVSGALNGARFAEVSTRDYDAYRDTGVNFRVAEGYGRLVSSLAANAPILFDCPVTRIDRSGPILRLETPRGAVEARAVVITVPTSLIASGALRIEPEPADWMEAASGVPLGLAAKLHLTVTGADDFPADSQLWGRRDTADTAGYHLRPFGRPMIEAYFGGPLAWQLEAEGEAAFLDFAVGELVSLLGSNMRRRLDAVATSMWGVDPWSRGAYSHALPGRAGDRARMRVALEDRLFLAGEATSPDFWGTVHGAWIEGERAADAALAAFGLARPDESEA